MVVVNRVVVQQTGYSDAWPSVIDWCDPNTSSDFLVVEIEGGPTYAGAIGRDGFGQLRSDRDAELGTPLTMQSVSLWRSMPVKALYFSDSGIAI